MTASANTRRSRTIRPGICLALLVVIGGPMACTTTAVDTSSMTFAPEPLLGKIVWNDLITEDIDAAQRFYGALFGWSFEPVRKRDDHPYVVARSGRVLVAGIVQVSRPQGGTNYSRWLPYASVRDVDAAVANAKAEGGTVPVTARQVGMGRIAVIVDTEGAVMGLARSRIGDPDDSTTAPGPGRVVWTELLANDPDAASRFYAKVIGYMPHTIERHGGPYTLLSYGGMDRAGIFRNPSEQAAPTWLTSFGVEDPVAAAARVEALGGKVILPPSPQLRDGTMALIEDPTGALLILRKTGT